MHGLVELSSQTREILIWDDNRDAGIASLVPNEHEAKSAQQTYFPDSTALCNRNTAKSLF